MSLRASPSRLWKNGFGTAPLAAQESGGARGWLSSEAVPPRPSDHRGGDIPGANTRLIVPKSRIRRNWAPQPAQSPGRLLELCRQQELGHPPTPLHPHSAPLFSPLPASQRHLTTRRPRIRTFTGKLDASRSLERRMERRTRWRWGGRRQQDTRLGLGDAGSRGKRSWRYGIRIYRIVMILPLPTRLCPPSPPFADLDHPMAFPQPSINPRTLAKFWVEQGYRLSKERCSPSSFITAPKRP